jgi:hypothetical protein
MLFQKRGIGLEVYTWKTLINLEDTFSDRKPRAENYGVY